MPVPGGVSWVRRASLLRSACSNSDQLSEDIVDAAAHRVPKSAPHAAGEFY
jgi:hypothetical protein